MENWVLFCGLYHFANKILLNKIQILPFFKARCIEIDFTESVKL